MLRQRVDQIANRILKSLTCLLQGNKILKEDYKKKRLWAAP